MTATRCSTAALALLILSTASFAHEGDPKLRDKQPAYQGPGWRNAQRMGTGGNLELGALAPAFPSSGIALLSWLTLSDFGVPGDGNGNSCFGYVSPSGREYAIMGLSTGTAFVEVTNPGNATIVAHIAGPQSLWRDVKVFQHYCYAGSEGGGGIQVMSMAQIDAGIVTLVNTVNDDSTPATHTLALNPASGYLYRDGGANQGLRMYNLNANPASPARVGTWSDRYVHEAQVVSYTSGPLAGREIAICCGGFNGGFNQTGIDVVDVTNKASPQLLQRLSYPAAGYSHQAWLSQDRQYLYLDDELDDENLGLTSTVRVFNASNPGALSLIGTFTNGNTSIDHNLYTKGNRIYQACYRSGLRVYDSTNQAHPVEIAYFDTYPDDDATFFNGLWNNYPYLPSGTIFGSDIERGLFVWWIGEPQIGFTLVNGEPTTVDPGGQTLAVDVDEIAPGTLQAGTAKQHVNTGGGWVVSDLVALGGNSYEAVLPAAPCGATVSYYFTGVATNGVIWSGPPGAPAAVHSATSAAASTTVFDDTMETNLGWVAGAAGDNATTGIWTRVDPNGTNAQPEDDHTGAPGVRCWVTGQGIVGGMDGDADVDGGKTTLTTPVLNMSALAAPYVSYWRWYSNNKGGAPGADVFKVDISNNNGSSWTNVETIGPAGAGTVGGWIYHDLRVADFVAPTAQVKLRFIAEDAGSGSVIEAAIDDFRVINLTCNGTTAFCFGDGSLATACPCGNFGATGHGCGNSVNNGGALLTATGTLNPDNVDFTMVDVPQGVATIYLQGDALIAAGTVFGDGVRCAGGSLIRLGLKIDTDNDGSTSFGPTFGDPQASVVGFTSSGNTYYYQAYYRNPNAAWCPPATFNISSGLTITWP